MADWKPHLKTAVQLLGSQGALGKAMGCSQAKISWLLLTAEQISAEDAIACHRATEGRVPASMLRPDLWRKREDVPLATPEQAGAGT